MDELSKRFDRHHNFHTHLDKGLPLPDADRRLRLAKNPLEGKNLPDNLPDISERLERTQSATDLAPVGPEESLQSPGFRPALSFADDG